MPRLGENDGSNVFHEISQDDHVENELFYETEVEDGRRADSMPLDPTMIGQVHDHSTRSRSTYNVRRPYDSSTMRAPTAVRVLCIAILILTGAVFLMNYQRGPLLEQHGEGTISIIEIKDDSMNIVEHENINGEKQRHTSNPSPSSVPTVSPTEPPSASPTVTPTVSQSLPPTPSPSSNPTASPSVSSTSNSAQPDQEEDRPEQEGQEVGQEKEEQKPRYCNLHATPPIVPHCFRNNTYCGDWSIPTRSFHPAKNMETNEYECSFRLFTPEEARQCLGSRTLAFMGDSQLRDLSTAIGVFLQGRTTEESYDYKYDHHSIEFLKGWADLVPKFEMWGGGEDRIGWFFPSSNITEKQKVNLTDESFDFQIQLYELYNNNGLYHTPGTSGKNHLDDVILGLILDDPVSKRVGLRSIDLLFWSYGLHDWGWWASEPYVENYFRNIVSNFVRIQSQSTFPSVWVSMNTECESKLSYGLMGDETHTQSMMVNASNQLLGSIMNAGHLPYYDADFVLRSPNICEVSDDGVHLKMWADLVRARMFFNYICDENNNWVGDSRAAFLL